MNDDRSQDVEDVFRGSSDSQHRQLEAALQESEARLQTLIDHLPAEIWAMDGDLCFTMQNAASSRVIGNVIGKRIEDLDVPDPLKARWIEEDRRVLAGDTLRDEYQIEANGEQKEYENFVAPVRVGDTIVGLVGVAMDITARKQAEEALKEAHAELERRVEQRTTELAQANRMLKILSECNQTVVRATEEAALLRDVCQVVQDLGGYPLVWVGFAEQDAARTVRPVAQTGFEDRYLNNVSLTWADTERGRGPVGTAIRSGRPCIASDIQTDPSFAPWREDAIRRGYASCIALPLWGDGRVFGALSIYASMADAFHAEEVHLLAELASDLAFGITSLREQAARNRAELVQAAIYRLSEATHTTLSLDELFASIHAIIAQLMPAPNFYIALCDAAAEVIHFPYYADDFDTTPPPQKTGRGLTELVLRTGKPLLATPPVFEQLVRSGQVQSRGAPSVDWLGVPLKTQRGETIGVMAVQTYMEDVRLGTPDQEVLEFVSTQVAMAIERKRAEEAVQRSEEKYRVLVENLSEVIFTLDMQGCFTYISSAVEQFTGFRPGQVAGQPFTRFVHPDDLPGLLVSFDRSLAGELEPYEFRVHGADGTVRHVRTSSHMLVEEGRAVGLSGVMSDITGRKQAEEALRQSEERYRALYEDTPSMYFTVDPAGTVLSVNRFGCEQLGYTAPELVGQSVLQVFHDEDRDAAAQCVTRCVANPGQVFHWELRKVHKAGRVLWVKETARAMRGPDGRVVVFVVCEDVTEHRRAEEERERLQAQLFQAQKMELLGRLAGGVAHDFNNMLFSILGHTELAMRLCRSSEPIHDYLEVIEESAHRSVDLVRQLLAFARKQTVTPRVLDLNDTVASMLNMLWRLIGEEIELVWMPGAGVWPVEIDPSQIDQLLANLCVNARDSIAGVGKVIIETRNAVFDEAYCAFHPDFNCGQYVMLAVSDDGCGMTPDVMAHLFEPFFTTKEVGKGTGLGLATVYGIVKQNEGFINVYSEPGKGSIFKIYLPRFEGQAVELKAARAAELPKSRGETVLLVEDEAAVLSVARAMLRELGYTVLAAGTPSEAVREAQDYAGAIELLITDVVMPEMSGRDLAELLGQVRPALKVLFASGYTADVISHHGVLEEGVHFLQKPFSIQDLASKVREVLGQESTV